MSDMIPDEVMAEILSRLPVKTLIRFRCVSKSWRVIIDSPYFIKKQLNHSLKTNSNQSIIFRSKTYDGYRLETYIHSADYDSFLARYPVTFNEFNHPLEQSHTLRKILGSCNGLICLLYQWENAIVLCNPSTRKYRILPDVKPKLQLKRTGSSVYKTSDIYGFGYDHVNADYKVVIGLQYEGFKEKKVDSEVRVYSLKSNSWKRAQHFPYYLPHWVNGVLANGALHWVARSTREYAPDTADLIAAFDLGTEEYRLVPQPEYHDNNFQNMNVGVLRGCLYVVCYYTQGHVDVWVMEEYGTKESWTNMISVACCHSNSLHSGSFRPIGYSKFGRQVLLELANRHLLWYDLDNKSTCYARKNIPHAEFSELGLFVHSLVQLNGVSCGKSANKTKNRKRRRSEERDESVSRDLKADPLRGLKRSL